MKGTFERLPRLDEKGVAWGGERTLIARAGTVELFWVPGCTWWDGVGKHYGESALVVRDLSGQSRVGTTLLSGARLTPRRLATLAPKLESYFGAVGVALILKAFKERRSASIVNIAVYGKAA
jgi:hypothetical protein